MQPAGPSSSGAPISVGIALQGRLPWRIHLGVLDHLLTAKHLQLDGTSGTSARATNATFASFIRTGHHPRGQLGGGDQPARADDPAIPLSRFWHRQCRAK